MVGVSTTAAAVVDGVLAGVLTPASVTLDVCTTWDVTTVGVVVCAVVCFCFCVVVVVGLSEAEEEVSVADVLSVVSVAPPVGAGNALTPTSKIASERRHRRRCISRFLMELKD